MNLLPKTADEFRDPQYWDGFFTKLGAEAFEWYSDFVDLAPLLLKYIKARDDVLIVGCGNSTLSSDLYDTGIEKITNIDLSEKVVQQMKKQNEKRRPNMNWLAMDAGEMNFQDQQFSVVLDKGTIDALMSNRTGQDFPDIDRILEQIDRVIRPTGRFICITLAQRHILNHLSKFFLQKKSWLLRFHHIQTRKSFALPVFGFVFTKINLKTPLIEVQLYKDSDKNWLRFNELSPAIDAILQCQIITFRQYEFKQKFVPKAETALIDLCEEGNQNKIRYQMMIVNGERRVRNRPYAAFIVPKSRNHDWLYATGEGRQEIIKNAQFSTIAFIFLDGKENYSDLDQIKSEMSRAVLDFKPSSVDENLQIPFLSTSEGIGEIRIRENSDSFVVEDCFFAEENIWKRRLRFHQNPNLIQSEVFLRLEPKSNELRPDFSKEENDYHQVILSALKRRFKNRPKTGRFLVVGLGGGVLTMKLISAFPKIELIGVDIDPEIVRIGKTWFGLDEEKCSCFVEDGLEFLRRQIEEKNQFDVIIFDVNNNDNQSSMRCPHPSFIEDSVLENVRKLILDRSGIFVLNFASRDSTNQDRDRCLTSLKRNFSNFSSVKVDDDINEVMMTSEKALHD